MNSPRHRRIPSLELGSAFIGAELFLVPHDDIDFVHELLGCHSLSAKSMLPTTTKFLREFQLVAGKPPEKIPMTEIQHLPCFLCALTGQMGKFSV
jgi:hypothetical protein